MENPKITNGPWFPVEYCGYIIVQDENNYGGLNVFDMDHFPLANNNAVAASATHELIDALIESHLTLQKIGEFDGVKYKGSMQEKMNIKALKKAGCTE